MLSACGEKIGDKKQMNKELQKREIFLWKKDLEDK